MRFETSQTWSKKSPEAAAVGADSSAAADHNPEGAFVASRSEALTVAVGFSPRLWARQPSRRGATLEPWVALPLHPSLRDGNHAGGHPWAEAHGYHHFVAPRLPETVSHAVAPRRGTETSPGASRAHAGALPSSATQPGALPPANLRWPSGPSAPGAPVFNRPLLRQLRFPHQAGWKPALRFMGSFFLRLDRLSRLAPLNRSGVSAERRHLNTSGKRAALCRDAATGRFMARRIFQPIHPAFPPPHVGG